MIKTMIARYAGRDADTGARIRIGDPIRYCTTTRKAWHAQRVDTITFIGDHGPTTRYRNARGRCEDAPCCGCCTI